MQGRSPDLIAVESSQRTWQKIVETERPTFLSKARADYRFAHVSSESLSLVLGHEVDTHHAIYGTSVPVLWLDQYRDEPGPDHRSAEGLGERFYSYLRGFLPPTGTIEPDDFMEKVYEDQTRHVPTVNISVEDARDKRWLDSLILKASEISAQNVVVIVGRDHLRDDRHTLKMLLNKDITTLQCEDVTLMNEPQLSSSQDAVSRRQ